MKWIHDCWKISRYEFSFALFVSSLDQLWNGRTFFNQRSFTLLPERNISAIEVPLSSPRSGDPDFTTHQLHGTATKQKRWQNTCKLLRRFVSLRKGFHLSYESGQQHPPHRYHRTLASPATAKYLTSHTLSRPALGDSGDSGYLTFLSLLSSFVVSTY